MPEAGQFDKCEICGVNAEFGVLQGGAIRHRLCAGCFRAYQLGCSDLWERVTDALRPESKRLRHHEAAVRS